MSTVDLHEIDDQLDEVRRDVDHGEAPYNPWALTALRAAEALRAEVDEANERTDATRQMAIDANAALRAVLSALDLEDDGRTPLTEYVTTLVAELDKARTAAAAIREVACGNKQRVAWLTAILEAVEKCAAGYEQIDGGTEKVKVYAADVAEKIRAALTAEPDEAHGEHTHTPTTQRPPIVVICGSTRLGDAFRQANLRETVAGRIVLSIGCDLRSDGDLWPDPAERERIKAELDELHKRTIDLADEVLVLNVARYIGSSTRSEIEYAKTLGKPIRYLLDQCASEYPDCPPSDRQCVQNPSHTTTSPLHFNRAGFAWSDAEAAEAGERGG